MDLAPTLDSLAERDWQDGPVEEPVRFAVVGLGSFARRVALPALAAADFCETTVLASGSPEKAAAWGTEFDARGLGYDAFHDGAAADAYDVVYVVTPNARHLPFAETAATLGKDVVCEKPLEATPRRARRLVDACATAGVTLMTRRCDGCAT